MNSINIAKRVSMVFMVSMLVALFLTAFVATVSAETGNTSAQEVGDAIYRYLFTAGISESHAGIYYRYLGGDPSDPHNHRIIHYGISAVEYANMSVFIAGNDYYGAHTASSNGKLDCTTRQAIIDTAEDLVSAGIGYAGFFDCLVPGWDGGSWDGTVQDIARIRCDGVVEYSYEANGVNVWGKNQQAGHYDITQPVTYDNYTAGCGNLYKHNDLILPIDPAVELTPNVQRGALGLQYTNMRASSPENPTKVSNLHSSSHNNAIGQWNDPQSRDNTIEVTWTDATDEQSGLWGYYVKWDNQPDTEPTWEDTKIDPGVETATSSELGDGDNGYFHIRSVDNAGNMDDSTAHLGPFHIDTTSPTAEFTHSVSELTVNFDASGSTDATSGIEKYSWDFDDSNGLQEDATEVTTSHTYPNAGTYTVTLKVWDKAGNDGTGAAQIAHPVEPVPELPTIALFSVGLFVLVGYVWLKRKNR